MVGARRISRRRSCAAISIKSFRLPEARLVFVTFDEIFGTRKRQPAVRPKKSSEPFSNQLERAQAGRLRRASRSRHRRLPRPQVSQSRRRRRRVSAPGIRRRRSACICRWTASTWCRNTSAATAPRRRSIVWAARLGKRSKPKRANRFSRWPKNWSSFTPCAKRAPAPPSRRRTTCTKNSKPAFEYEETPDQQRAIDETLAGMQGKKPMDRLICGDVGYGKTEVAMRAAFLAVEGGKQVAVLAPTTILAQQHLQTFRHRFRNHPVRVEMVSRFLTAKEIAQVLAGDGQGQGRYRHRHPSFAAKRRRVQGSGSGDRRRRAPLRRGAQGAAQKAAPAGRRA